MLVQCPECTTKYNLDESKIGHDGSKVRCTRCKNVFTVFRPISEDVATPEIPEPSPADGAFDNDFFDDDPASAFENKKSAPAAANESFEDELAAMFEDVKAAPASKKSADADAFEDDLAAMLDGQKSQRMPKSPADESFEDDLTAMLDEKRTKAESKSAVDKEMIADLQGAFQQPLTALPASLENPGAQASSLVLWFCFWPAAWAQFISSSRACSDLRLRCPMPPRPRKLSHGKARPRSPLKTCASTLSPTKRKASSSLLKARL
jgi:predicted Zn finger-like uncharacterized protein